MIKSSHIETLMLDIYKYSEIHRFLTDAWREKRARNPAFSMTAWSKQMGLGNSSPLSLAFKGKRTLPKKYLPQIIRTLGLDSQQAQYLEALLDLSRAKSAEQRLFYIKRLSELSPGQEFSPQLVEEFKYLSNPLHGAIIEMTELRVFQNDAEWIQSRLQFDIPLREVRETIDRLLELKLLQLVDGRLRKTQRHLSTPGDVADLGSRKYHEEISELAKIAVSTQDVKQREFNSYSFNIKKEKLAAAKLALRQFVQDFLNAHEAPEGEGDETFQLNLQLFQLSK